MNDFLRLKAKIKNTAPKTLEKYKEFLSDMEDEILTDERARILSNPHIIICRSVVSDTGRCYFIGKTVWPMKGRKDMYVCAHIGRTSDFDDNKKHPRCLEIARRKIKEALIRNS
jgi:hypothetical protein